MLPNRKTLQAELHRHFNQLVPKPLDTQSLPQGVTQRRYAPAD